MEALFSMIKSIDGNGSITFPIKSMYGFSVDASIDKNTHSKIGGDGANFDVMRYYFKIADDHYHCEDHHRYYYKSFDPITTDDELKIILEYCVLFIKKCEINKLAGKFYLKDEEMSPYIKNLNDFAKLADLFEDVEHIKTIVNRCCVCHEWTRTSLKACKHPVCLDCLRQLTVADCDSCDGDDPNANCDRCQGLEKVQSCPMCREYIIEGIDV